MTDANTNEPRDPNAAEDAPPPKKAGFGAFADKYRDRWAAGHPDARKPGGRDLPPAAPPSDAPTTPATPRAADGADDAADADADKAPGA